MPALVALTRSRDDAGNVIARLGLPLTDEYLEFLAGRCRPNTVLAVAYDLKVFLIAVGKPPDAVTTADVLAFMTAQRAGGRGRLQLAGVNADGVSARTLRRRLSSVPRTATWPVRGLELPHTDGGAGPWDVASALAVGLRDLSLSGGYVGTECPQG